MPTPTPKRVLIHSIIKITSEDAIRAYFNIDDSTELSKRLNAFRKQELETFIRSLPDGQNTLNQLEQAFPFNSPKIFYLMKVKQPNTNELELKIKELAAAGREARQAFGNNRAVRCVFAAGEAIHINELQLYEIPLFYEQKLEYVVADPNADNYGEETIIYTLEKGLIWLSDKNSHSIICCSGIASLRAIIDYGTQSLGLRWYTPNMTDEMFERLTSGGSPSRVTFTGSLPDVPTVSVYAKGLANSEIYTHFSADPNLYENTEYLTNADSILWSFGVSRKPARVWTPRKLPKLMMVSAAHEIIMKTENELHKQYESGLQGYVSYFDSVPVTIGQTRPLRKDDRQIFSQLMVMILHALRNANKQQELDSSLLYDLIAHQTSLRLRVITNFECNNCGGGLGRCPDCLTPYDVKLNDAGQLYLICPNKHMEVSGDSLTCECGNIIDVPPLESVIQLYPEPELLDSVSNLFDLMHEVTWDRTSFFFIDGYLLSILQPRRNLALPGRISLEDLHRWRHIARHHQRTSIPNQKRVTQILKTTKEKCRRNGSTPTKDLCKKCLDSVIRPEQMLVENELCLPRIMGLAIGQGFDGIHHGQEIADVKYKDIFEDTGQEVSIGVHLKSRQASKPKGLGRSAYSIKSLYTQIFYSAYQVMKGKAHFDIIGLSIPNTIHTDTVNSIQNLLNRLGFSLLVIDEREWFKILDAVIEQLAFNE